MDALLGLAVNELRGFCRGVCMGRGLSPDSLKEAGKWLLRHEASLEFEPVNQVVEILHALVRKEEFGLSDQLMVRQLADLELADRGWFSPDQTGIQELSGILGGILARRCLDAIGLALLVEWLEAQMQKAKPSPLRLLYRELTQALTFASPSSQEVRLLLLRYERSLLTEPSELMSRFQFYRKHEDADTGELEYAHLESVRGLHFGFLGKFHHSREEIMHRLNQAGGLVSVDLRKDVDCIVLGACTPSLMSAKIAGNQLESQNQSGALNFLHEFDLVDLLDEAIPRTRHGMTLMDLISEENI